MKNEKNENWSNENAKEKTNFLITNPAWYVSSLVVWVNMLPGYIVFWYHLNNSNTLWINCHLFELE